MKSHQKVRRPNRQDILALTLLGFIAAALTGVSLPPPASLHGSLVTLRRTGKPSVMAAANLAKATTIDLTKPIPSSITLSKDIVVVGDSLGITVTTTQTVNDIVLVSISDPTRFTPVPNADNPPSLHPWPYRLRYTNSNVASFSVVANTLPALTVDPVGVQVFACQKDADTTLPVNKLCALPVSVVRATQPIPISTQPIPISLKPSKPALIAGVEDFDVTVALWTLIPGSNAALIDVSDRSALISPSGVWPYTLPFNGRTNALLHIKTVARTTNLPVTIAAYPPGVTITNPANRQTFATILLTPTPPSSPASRPAPRL